MQFLAENTQEEVQDTDDDSRSSILELETFITKESTLYEINTSVTDIGKSSFKFHAVPLHSKTTNTRRKIELVCCIILKKSCYNFTRGLVSN